MLLELTSTTQPPSPPLDPPLSLELEPVGLGSSSVTPLSENEFRNGIVSLLKTYTETHCFVEKEYSTKSNATFFTGRVDIVV